jgi:hypothetical protein
MPGLVPGIHVEGFWSIFKRGIVRSFYNVNANCMPLCIPL